MTCSAERYRFCPPERTIDKNVQEIIPDPNGYEAMDARPVYSLHGGGPIPEDFGGRSSCGVSTPSSVSGDPKRMRGRSYLPGFIQAQCNQEMPIFPPQSYSRIPLAAWLVSPPFTVARASLQQMIDSPSDLFQSWASNLARVLPPPGSSKIVANSHQRQQKISLLIVNWPPLPKVGLSNCSKASAGAAVHTPWRWRKNRCLLSSV